MGGDGILGGGIENLHGVDVNNNNPVAEIDRKRIVWNIIGDIVVTEIVATYNVKIPPCLI